jgi:hypothetical protein
VQVDEKSPGAFLFLPSAMLKTESLKHPPQVYVMPPDTTILLMCNALM